MTSVGSLPRPWLLLQIGLLALVVRDAVVVFGSASDLPFAAPPTQLATLIGYGCVIASLLVLIASRVRENDLSCLLEAVIGPTTLAFLAWILVVAAQVQQGHLALTPALFGLALPALDVVVLSLALRLLLLDDGRARLVAYRYVLVGAGCLLAADLVRAVKLLGGPETAGIVPASAALGAWVLWCLAGMHASARTELEPAPPIPTTLGRGRVALVLAAVLSGPAVLGIQSARHLEVVVLQFVVGHMVVAGVAVAYLVRLVEERARVEHLALHDDLTGLPNRVLFSDRVAAALAHAQRTRQSVALLYLDLDRFKNINDSLGHAAGNELLRLVSRRLQLCVREDDTVARLSGDEFALLLPEVGAPTMAGVVAEKILAAFADPFSIAKRELFVSPSIGIALFPSDGTDVTTLLKNADTAMYRAKERGRNNYQLYTADMNARAHERLALETSLHTAIGRNELILHYQPKVDLRTGRIVGMEALVRWTHPQRGLLSPAAFIPLAEETGLIVPLGEWALETACTQTRKWHDAGHRSLTVAVNLSARQFEQQRVESMVAKKLRSSGLDPHSLELELTESLALQDPDAIRSTLEDLRDMGVRCSIDDFGTGYSGLSYLTRLPINRLKIDKCFVHEIARGDDDARIVAAVIALAHNLRLGVTAEGVETTEQLDFLREHGCDEMQGFLFSRPVPAAQFEQLLQREQVSPTPRSFDQPRIAALSAVS